MKEILVKDVSANYDEDLKKVLPHLKTLSIGFNKEEDRIDLSVDLGAEDHYISASVDRAELIKAISDTLVEQVD